MEAQSPIRRAALAALAIVALAIAAYLPSFAGVFLLDDYPSLVENPWIRRLWPPGPSWWSVPYRTLHGRPVVAFTFALNHAAGGFSIAGYHAVNLAIHAANGVLILAIARRALRAAGRDSGFTSFAIAALWTVHPLCTSAVTYVIQRCESLSAFFFLAAFLCAQVALESRRPRPAVVGAALCAWLAVGSKVNTVVLPLVVLAYAATVRGETPGAAWRAHRGLLLALFSSWIALAVLLASTGSHALTTSAGAGADRFEYARTQAVAILHYLRLAVFPHPLVFDYGWPRPAGHAHWIGAGLCVLALVGATAWLVARKRPIGFLGAWFFLILAPTSSLFPITTQLWAEHRMYLPLAAALALVGLLVSRVPRPIGCILLATALVAASWRTVVRNRDYHSAETLWRGVLVLAPDNARAHDEMATILREQGRRDEARAELAAAARLQPDFPLWRANYGASLWEARELEAAERELRAAVALLPTLAMARANLGGVLQDLGKLDEAEAELREAARLRPEWPRPVRQIAFLLFDRGRYDDAEPLFAALFELTPGDVEIARRLETCRARKTPR